MAFQINPLRPGRLQSMQLELLRVPMVQNLSLVGRHKAGPGREPDNAESEPLTSASRFSGNAFRHAY